MANLRTDSPVSRRIACSFLQFLNSVEPSAGVDSEALDVAKECLAEVFKIDQSSNDSLSNCDSLVDIFNSYEANAPPIFGNRRVYDAQSLSSGKNAEVSNETGSLDPDRTSEPHSSGKDELFGHFFGALEKIHHFKTMPDGSDDQTQLDRATYLFHNAFEEMQKAGCRTFDEKVLAETFKAQGNKAMQSTLYTEAIELYTFAIALHDDNAIYYCNRAAAYTQIHLYTEAVHDCLKSIEINPNYSKAYSRLGFAYYAQGKYRDAIDKGFMKALQLDPDNDSVKENIRVAEQKLREQQQRGGPGQSSTSTSHGSMSFNINGGLPSDFSNMFMNMAGNTFPGQDVHSGPHRESDSGAHEPGVGLGGNVNGTSFPSMPFNLNGGLPSDFSSMFMNMSRNAFPGQDDVHSGPHGGSEPGAHEPGIRLGGNVDGRSFSSMPFNISGGLPSDFSTMFMNMAGDRFSGQPVHSGLNGESEDGASNNEPGIRLGVDVNVDVNELPEEFSGAFTSVMGTWATSGGNQQDSNNNGRSDAR